MGKNKVYTGVSSGDGIAFNCSHFYQVAENQFII